MDELLGALGGAGNNDIGAMLGNALGGDADSAKVEAATKTGLGAILGALAGNAAESGGAESLLGAIKKDHDGSAIDNPSSVLGSPQASADGQKILAHAFGNNAGSIEGKVAEKSGLDIGMVTKLLPMLAPVVMGMLAKKAKQGDGMDASALSGLLKGESDGLDLGDLTGLLGGLGGAGGAADLISSMTGGADAGGSKGGLMATIMDMLKKFGSKK